MLISCKCLNFIATSNNSQKQSQQQLPAGGNTVIVTADSKKNNATVTVVAMQQFSNDCSNMLAATSSNNNEVFKPSKGDSTKSFSLTNILRQTFLQKYPRSFIFYSQCMDFFKQAIGPVADLTISALSQRDLIYSLILEINASESSLGTKSSWQLCICSNCNLALCARLLNTNSPQFLINCGLLTNNEELSQKRSDKSFSDTFDLLIMDHPNLEITSNNQNQNTGNSLTIGSLSGSFVLSSTASNHLDSKHLRLRQLQANLQQRLQKEIAETDERIQRYTSQQFALLKSFREKSEQEYHMLASLIQCIPEQQANEWLERQPPALDVGNNGGNFSFCGVRRRNTVCSRRDITNTATTLTAAQPPNNMFNTNKENYMKNSMNIPSTSPISAITTIDNTVDNNSQSPTEATSTAGDIALITPPIASSSSALNRKISNFDTPPATPEAIPMSVGNSPTFRHQQQRQAPFANQTQTYQQQFPTPTIETADDCLFELEGVESSNTVTAPEQQKSQMLYLQNPSSELRGMQSRQQQLQSQNVSQIQQPYNTYQHNFSYINTQPDNQMNDFDTSDAAEEAEDALDLDTAMPIVAPHRRINLKHSAQASNFAKSLPIEISNSPRAIGRKYMASLESDEDEFDNNVDIAASIKALAKSVHGEAVFGDLPRPRLRSQI